MLSDHGWVHVVSQERLPSIQLHLHVGDFVAAELSYKSHLTFWKYAAH